MLRGTAGEVLSLARAHQFQLHPLAMKRLVHYLENSTSATPNPHCNDAQGRRAVLRELFSALQSVCVDDRIVSESAAEAVVAQVASRYRVARDQDAGDVIAVLTLSQFPLLLVEEVTGEVHSAAKLGSSSQPAAPVDRVSAFRQRYLFAQRRCFASGLFRRKVHTTDTSLLELPPLLVTSSMDGLDPTLLVAVLGVLAKRGDEYYLEDLRNSVKLSFSQLATGYRGFLGNRFLVVVVGYWVLNTFVARSVSCPPPVQRSKTLAMSGASTVDFFGLRPDRFEEALMREKQAVQAVIVVFSHVYLDEPKTLDRLRLFFSELKGRTDRELSQMCFVFAGNFSKEAIALEDVSHLPEALPCRARYASLLEVLGQRISSVAPNVAQHAHFVLVPGPTDLSAVPGVLPVAPIPGVLLQGLRSKLKRVASASNPCRIRFFTHEVAVVRRDFLRSFLLGEKELGVAPSEEMGQEAFTGVGGRPCEDPLQYFERVSKTLVDSAHLAPDAVDTVAWKMDHALRLDILPDTIVVCDSTDHWECRYQGANLINPGSFSSKATFLWYTPSDGEGSVSSVE